MIGTGTLSRSLSRLQVVVVFAGVATPGIQFACGPPNPTPPTPPLQTPAASRNPCPATPASFRAGFGALPVVDNGSRALHVRARRTVLDAVWEHRLGLERGLILPPNLRAAAEDAGEIAVLRDEGDLILAANIYDLRDVTLRFEPAADGGYDVTRVGPATWRAFLGNELMLGDDDTALLALPFEFPYYSRTHASAFVNSDGNVTFEAGDDASTLRNISRLLTGPPRIAPFLTDLDPSAGGAVFTGADAEVATVTWCAVPEFDSQTDRVTVQVSMLSNGNVEMTFDGDIAVRQVLVGLSPGRTEAFEAVDLSETRSTSGASEAVGSGSPRRTSSTRSRWPRSSRRPIRMLMTSSSSGTDRPGLFTDAFAYEIGVANSIRGIGLPIYDHSAEFRSEELESIVVMGWLHSTPTTGRRR